MMKKLALALLVGALVALVTWLVIRPGDDRPAVADVLSAEHTAAVVGARSLDGLTRRWLPLAALAPDDIGLADPARRVEKLGFDPATADGWRSIGIDPAAGVAAVFDARLATDDAEPVPLVLIGVSDRDALIAWMKKSSEREVRIEGSGKVETLVVGERTALMTRRGAYTAFAFPGARGPDAIRAGFTAFAEDDDKKLSASDAWRGAFDGAGDAMLYAFSGATATGSLVTRMGQPVATTAIVDYYARLFPAGLVWSGDGGSGARLFAAEAGVALLRKLGVPQRGAPKFARYLPPQGWSALRLSVNLPELFDGAATAMPPAAGDARRMLGMIPVMLPLAAGVTWDEITGALSGHVVIAADASALRDPKLGAEVLLMLGVADGERADALLQKLLAQLTAKAPGATATPVDVAGHPGQQVALAEAMTTLVRIDDVILVGPAAVVTAAAGRDDHLEGSGADAIDGDVVAGAFVDLAPFLAEPTPQITAILQNPAFAPLKESPRLDYTVALDRHGLLATLHAPIALDLLVAGVGVAASREATRRATVAPHGIEPLPDPFPGAEPPADPMAPDEAPAVP